MHFDVKKVFVSQDELGVYAEGKVCNQSVQNRDLSLPFLED